MLKVQIMPLLARRPAKKPMFGREQVASEQVQGDRLAVCGGCEYNKAGMCRQCCGAVPVVTLVRLAASRCARGFWRA